MDDLMLDEPRSGVATRSPMVMLVTATIGFAVNFWAWALISPLGPLFREKGTLGHLTESDVALMVAVPVIVGSLGRILVGALTDKLGGRVMFPIISAVTIVPVLFIGFFAQTSYAALLFGGFFLGIAGTAFAVGVPFVNAWFPPERRGLAIGVFGAGMGGTAISALTTVKLYTNVGSRAPFLITAAVLAVYAVVAWLVLRDAPGRTAPTSSLLTRLSANARLSITWQACLLYAVAFGGYVAFSVYLPAYLKTDYGLTPADAANRMAGFVVVAVVMRPLGGWLSDRFGPIPVLASGYAVVVVGAGVAATHPLLEHVGTVAFLAMAAALGAGSGATFALIALVTEPSRVGGVTGLVGAAGGLGGFAPPLVMGYVYGRTDSYAIGLWLLSVTAALALLLTLTVVRHTAAQHATQEQGIR
ncbi:NNP family nitrate/nitrite transporter-like MFS transporter [Nocardioides ginsengisegetis]|uniref:NNP family nitrate/nitrite transporter-like MFS transporter n=1 Tax=Nocardioides ginsengisegetis TaxID=661491 RepID=A0A7W3IWL7_9ACTN|nr:MFS transporter [Nocardioides ginsengisegetis]MBA8801963.1 NNP family nitrate/nitrite transporter-like MFS transporter [Nocardioides ginsengisegetis]